MSSGVETAEIIEPWIFTTLNGDAAIRAVVGDNIYGALYPEEIHGPYVSVTMIALKDIRGVGQNRIQVEALYQVKVTDQSSTQDTILPVVVRINALLDHVNTTFNGGYITSTRDTIISYSDVAHTIRGSGGDAYIHLGSTFRIRASSAT